MQKRQPLPQYCYGPENASRSVKNLKCKRERRKIIGLPFVDCITVFLLLKHVCVF